ncbi:hypothetical protein R1T08_29090 [Streptomyces sp. SBC-4]|nr:hypothetical protein [Streptomyces sp. SBC-4]MDV5148113.1 hypothetical protein [Streptomyces sp. SBC-4]
MSRSFRRIGALGAATVALVTFGAAAPVTAAPGSAAPDAAGTRAVALDFTLYARDISGDEGEESPPAPEAGDSFVFAEDLFRSKGGEQLGRDGVTCTVVRPDNPGELLCVGTFILTGGPAGQRGQIAGQALLPIESGEQQPAPFDIAVTGGTGDFKDVTGHIRSTPDGAYSRLEFHLTRP